MSAATMPRKMCKQCRKFICRCERQRIIRDMLYAHGPANPEKNKA